MLWGMLLRLLPLITGLLPIVAIHLSLVIAIDAGSIPACIPYIEGCVSISATGRYPPASFLFKAVMMAESVVMIAYWLFNVAWIRSLEKLSSMQNNGGTAIGILGTGGALFLMLYVTFLGTQEPFYEFMRRFGIYFYFALTIIAQILLAVKSKQMGNLLQIPSVIRIAKIQLGLATVPFALGVLNLTLKATLADPDPAENVIEWIFALLMHAYFVLSYFSWRDSGFAVRYVIHSR
ncbi:MAG: hypothetical protein DRR11_09200 [Gammaproteobacteria bacterium]|nr:MAG: hypothetical protein DRR11_09200 [Gammaproteobacteria bacterium]